MTLLSKSGIQASTAMLNRFRFVRDVLWRPAMAVVVAIVGSLAGLRFIRDDLMPSEWRERLRILTFLPNLTWEQWVIVLLVALILRVLEAAFRLNRTVRMELDRVHAVVDPTTLAAIQIAFQSQWDRLSDVQRRILKVLVTRPDGLRDVDVLNAPPGLVGVPQGLEDVSVTPLVHRDQTGRYSIVPHFTRLVEMQPAPR